MEAKSTSLVPVLQPGAHRLVQGSIDLQPVQPLLGRIVERYHPNQIWLFGSRARGQATASSDWDLFVVLPDDALEDDLNLTTAWRLQKGCGVAADVIPCRAREFLEDLGVVNTLSHEVAREAVVIYER